MLIFSENVYGLIMSMELYNNSVCPWREKIGGWTQAEEISVIHILLDLLNFVPCVYTT